jgi:DNA replication protein DnaC
MQMPTGLTETAPSRSAIGIEIEQVLKRLQDKRSSFSEPPEKKGPPHSEIDAILEQRGFPARHRARLREGLHGPGLEKAKELLPKIIGGNCLLLLIGDRGPGKTQIATWWAAERVRAGKFAGWYRKTVDLISEIKVTWNAGGKSIGTEDDILKKYRSAAFLVLDEFHERGSSEWEARTLTNIIDHRYDSMRATVLIANMTAAQAQAQIHPSILSRAEETGGVVRCDWASYRQDGMGVGREVG